MPESGPVPLGFRLHHLPAPTRFRLGRLRCLAYGGAFPARSPRAGRDWHRAAARERAAFERLAGGGEIDLLFCHDPRTLEQGAQASGPLRRARRETPPGARHLRPPTPPARKRRRTPPEVDADVIVAVDERGGVRLNLGWVRVEERYARV